MKKRKLIIGIDVSKDKLDVFFYKLNQSFVVKNNHEGFVSILEKALNTAKCSKDELFVCFENTGKYSRQLSMFLHTEKIDFLSEWAMRIKRSVGITRGKNDKVDARRIALYAYEKYDNLTPTLLPGADIEQIKTLLSLREKLLKHRTGFKNGLKDLYDCYFEGENDLIKEIQQRQVSALNIEIEKVEYAISAIIEQDDRLIKNYNLLLTVKGVGKILAFYLIAYTSNFTLFDTARAFASYSGIAPFGYSSGTMIGKTRVHPFGNKTLKSMLTLAALSAIQQRGEYQQYYKKRTCDLGKNKMSTVNIIRNKIVFRVFAVIQRQSPYIDLFRFVA